MPVCLITALSNLLLLDFSCIFLYMLCLAVRSYLARMICLASHLRTPNLTYYHSDVLFLKQTSNAVSLELIFLPRGSGYYVHRVTEVCGAKRLGYFGTPQFYVALKLLAAAQAGLPVRLESASAANLPLPRFVGIQVEAQVGYAEEGVRMCQGLDSSAEQKSWSPPPPSPCSSPPRSPPAYHTSEYTAHRKMADTVLQKEQQHSSPSPYGTTAQATTSDHQHMDEDDNDPWRMTEEQREYYTNQFQSLQPDLGAFILGAVAKNFFTKSKLPIPELSHIWELSDMDRDGALTFSEFCTAFHLIVARKNGFPLPESLPPSLRPGCAPQDKDAPQHTQPLLVFGDSNAGLNKMNVPEAIEKAAAGWKWLPGCTWDTPAPASMSATVSVAKAQQDVEEESRKAVCSFRSVVALQEGATLQTGAFCGRPGPPSICGSHVCIIEHDAFAKWPSSQDLDPHTKTKTRPRSFSSTSIEDAMRKVEEPPTPPPRPQKSHSRASSLDLNKLFQQGAPGLKSGWLPPPPPPPALPPRPSSSQVPPHFVATDKTPPHTKVQQPNFADFSRFAEEDTSGGCRSDQAPPKPLRRKYRPDGWNPESVAPPSAPFVTPSKPNQKWSTMRGSPWRLSWTSFVPWPRRKQARIKFLPRLYFFA
ncbi:ralBP1-associated Eps domain-containing protein 2 isoform X3 [Dunckerocampus dactyliophorus]|uniref:ralBP1-associated Eps domain-containing protein 2 isoform X3 n=1 Tax=Dunckerocampus dactyliophorus TaxID=161453 RepID=UPI0024057790|nr:ralBP1-associated Eps domain-containing protein 2 isoform X3 [Dunckerocampus dactyliophorus]